MPHGLVSKVPDQGEHGSMDRGYSVHVTAGRQTQQHTWGQHEEEEGQKQHHKPVHRYTLDRDFW